MAGPYWAPALPVKDGASAVPRVYWHWAEVAWAMSSAAVAEVWALLEVDEGVEPPTNLVLVVADEAGSEAPPEELPVRPGERVAFSLDTCPIAEGNYLFQVEATREGEEVARGGHGSRLASTTTRTGDAFVVAWDGIVGDVGVNRIYVSTLAEDAEIATTSVSDPDHYPATHPELAWSGTRLAVAYEIGLAGGARDAYVMLLHGNLTPAWEPIPVRLAAAGSSNAVELDWSVFELGVVWREGNDVTNRGLHFGRIVEIASTWRFDAYPRLWEAVPADNPGPRIAPRALSSHLVGWHEGASGASQVYVGFVGSCI